MSRVLFISRKEKGEKKNHFSYISSSTFINIHLTEVDAPAIIRRRGWKIAAGSETVSGIKALEARNKRRSITTFQRYKRGRSRLYRGASTLFLDPRASCRGNEHLTTGDSQPLRTVRSDRLCRRSWKILFFLPSRLKRSDNFTYSRS